ncbi:MAG: DUF4157 domain-containing protein [Pyrinomonadaceae bacterium]|nr:DUF4157 domain-containing protein [Pyrinomonadaceae bacterium]
MSRASQNSRNMLLAQSSSTVQPKRSGVEPTAGNRAGRAPVAPPAYRPQPATKVAQPKACSAASCAPARAAQGAPSGIIQANIVGGTHALQARLALWHTSAQRQAASSQTSVQRSAVQRKSGPGVEAFQVPLQPKSGGQPIPDQVRAKMETAFGMDFSDVRIHVGQEAMSIGALAYTWGTNIHFAPGQYNPHTIQGQKILGHELWHVVQQKSGRVSNPFGSGVAVVQDHALEAEADRMGVKAAMTAPVHRHTDNQ